MDFLNQLQKEFLELKSDTYFNYAKKVEIAHKMLIEEKEKLRRLNNMKQKASLKLQNSKFFKRKFYRELEDRINKKIKKTHKKVIQLNNLYLKYLEEFKRHREFIGLTDHSFIDDFYKN